MKTREGIRYFLTASLAAVLILTTSSSFADDGPPAPAIPPKPARPPKPAPPVRPPWARAPSGSDYDLEIAHGMMLDGKDSHPATLDLVLESLRKRYFDANIVVAPGLNEVQIDDLKFRGNNLPEELEALRIASGSRFDWTGPNSPGPNISGGAPSFIDPNTGLPVATPQPDPNSGLFVIRSASTTGENGRVMEAFNIGAYLNRGMDAGFNENQATRLREQLCEQVEDVILETIAHLKQVSLSTMQKPSFQFHPGATLLIVIGSQEDVNVARKVISALPGESRVVEKNRMEAIVRAAVEPLMVEVIPLKATDPGTAYATATAVMTDKRGKIVVDDRAKTLVVVATKPEVSAIKAAIEKLERGDKPYVGDRPILPAK